MAEVSVFKLYNGMELDLSKEEMHPGNKI